MAERSTETRPRTGTDPVVTTLRVASVAAVVVLLFQFTTAGGYEATLDSGWIDRHGVGAIALHVVTGVAALAAAALWRLRGAPAWPAVLGAVVFVLTFVQAYLGTDETLAVHIPGAMVLTVGSVVLTVWALGGPAAGSRARRAPAGPGTAGT